MSSSVYCALSTVHSRWCRADTSLRRPCSRPELTLHQDVVEATIEFVANVLEHIEVLEAGGHVHADRSRLFGITNDSDHQAETAFGGGFDQFFQQRFAHTTTMSIGRHVH